jgi:hypothetical protein
MTTCRALILENFKAFKRRQDIPLSPVTLLFGPNSAGKSSIIHALALLRHAFLNHGHAEADTVDLLYSEVRLGGWQNLVHMHDANRTFKIGLKFESDRTPHLRPSEGVELWEVVWEFGRNVENLEAAVTSITAQINGRSEFSGKWDSRNKLWNLVVDPHSINVSGYLESFQGELITCLKNAGVLFDQEQLPILQKWLSELHDAPMQSQGFFPNVSFENVPTTLFLQHLFPSLSPDGSCYKEDRSWDVEASVLLSAFKKIQLGDNPSSEESEALHQVYINWALRTWHSRQPYHAAALAVESILSHHAHLDSVRERPKYALNLRDLPDVAKYRPWRKLISEDELRRNTSASLEVITRQPGQKTGFALGLRSRTIEVSSYESRQSIKSTSEELAIVNPQGLYMGIEDVGYGISTILPIITAMSCHNIGIVSIEQPELHIHPRLQTEIGDLFLMSCMKNHNLLLIETHSEHLMLRILRRIRETSAQDFSDWSPELIDFCNTGIRPRDVAVLYVIPSDEGAEVTELPITPDGDFSCAWPTGFFTDRDKELF